MSVILNATTSTGLTMTPDNSGTVQFQTAGTNTMYIDGSGNVGIGTSSPSARLQITDGNFAQLYLLSSTTVSGVRFGNTAYTNGYIYYDNGANMPFQTNGAERMRIDSSGNLLVGTMSATNNPSQGITLMQNTSVGNIGIGHANGTANGNTYMNFCYNGTQIGTIFQATTSSVTYQTTSDYRLKENVQKLNNGLSTVLSLNPVSYTWKRGGETDEGFIAHELQQYIPNAVSGEKDDVNEDGSIKPQGVDYSKIVVHLVAALQELKATVDAQATEIAALKAKVGA